MDPLEPPAGGPETEPLVAAAALLDADRLNQTLDEQFGRASFEYVVDGWLMPNLVSLGRAWAEGGSP